jgi:hypothetical protein
MESVLFPGWDEWQQHYNDRYVAPPKRALNGGLYTGEPFAAGAAWANVPMLPDAGYLTHYGLRLVDPPPPPGAMTQYPGCFRPGNSFSPLPGTRNG